MKAYKCREATHSGNSLYYYMAMHISATVNHIIDATVAKSGVRDADTHCCQVCMINCEKMAINIAKN